MTSVEAFAFCAFGLFVVAIVAITNRPEQSVAIKAKIDRDGVSISQDIGANPPTASSLPPPGGDE